MREYKKADDEWEVLGDEKEGIHKNKTWMEHIKTGKTALFKPDTELSESIVEYEVFKISENLQIPCAEIELVEFSGLKGCLSYHYRHKLVKPGDDIVFIHADDLYEKGDMVTYRSKDSNKKSLSPIPEITLEIVRSRIPQIEKSVVDMLFLDCLVSNRDRHGYNWDIAMTEEGQAVGIAPLFDHGYSLWHKYIPEQDDCVMPWADDVELTHYAMFETLIERHSEQIKNLLDKCAKLELIDFVKPRFKKMLEIYDRVIDGRNEKAPCKILQKR